MHHLQIPIPNHFSKRAGLGMLSEERYRLTGSQVIPQGGGLGGWRVLVEEMRDEKGNSEEGKASIKDPY